MGQEEGGRAGRGKGKDVFLVLQSFGHIMVEVWRSFGGGLAEFCQSFGGVLAEFWRSVGGAFGGTVA